MTDYRRRVIDDELDELLPDLPAVLLDGPRGVGKTETGSRRAATIVRLDDPAQRQIAEAAPTAVLRGDEPILIDEWHRVPAVWDAVRRAVDHDPRGARFLLTGSAASQAPVHSGAGRIVTLRMRPMNLGERGIEEPTVPLSELAAGGRPEVHGRTDVGLRQIVTELARSGLPGLLGIGARARRRQLDGYLDLIVQRDVPEQGLEVRRADALRAWLTAYAAATATTASWEKIRDASTAGVDDKPARTTVRAYADTLAELRLLDEVPAWAARGSPLRRLIGSRKHHLADPALAARLLGVEADALLSGADGDVPSPRDGTLLGALFESLVALHVRPLAQRAELRVHHLRTRAGRHEVDLILERADGRVIAVEAKLSGAIRDEDVRHLRWLEDQIGDRLVDAIVVNTGPAAFRRPDGVAVVPLPLLG